MLCYIIFSLILLILLFIYEKKRIKESFQDFINPYNNTIIDTNIIHNKIDKLYSLIKHNQNINLLITEEN